MDAIKRLLDTAATDLAMKAAALDNVTDNTYEAAATAMSSIVPEIADALYAAANEMHKAAEAMRNAASILETASESVW